MSELDKMIIERAKSSPMSWTVQTSFDQANLIQFVKSFALDAIYDSAIQKQLLEINEEKQQ
jgi:hypothetical protein